MKKLFVSPSSLGQPLLAVCLLSPLAALAAGEVPNAGSLLQQVQPSLPPTPSRNDTGLVLPAPTSGEVPATRAFEVKRIEIFGNTLFVTDTLHALVANAEGRSMTLAEVNAVVDRITAFYRARGYALSRAVVPAQRLQDGVLRVEVIEARYGEVRVDNRSEVSSTLVQDMLSGLQSGQVVAQDELERVLLLLADVPGVVPQSALGAGQKVGETDVELTLQPGQQVQGNVGLDGYGNRYTGRARVQTGLQVNNALLGYGDVASLNVMTTGHGMDYARLGYESLLNGAGTSAGAAYSNVRYKLGGDLARLASHGSADVSSVWLRHPLVRGRDSNVYARVQYDRKALRDHVDSGPVYTDRDLDNWGLGLSGDVRDELLGGGANAWSLNWMQGRVDFANADALKADQASAGTQGVFHKTTLNVSRLQNVGPKTSLYFAWAAQWASGNLDASEKMSAGGPVSVRAYDTGAVSGDAGQFATLELRQALCRVANGELQGRVFVDAARVRVNQSPWKAGENHVDLNGTGAGLDWNGPERWQARLAVATRTGGKPTLVADTAKTRVWVEATKAF